MTEETKTPLELVREKMALAAEQGQHPASNQLTEAEFKLLPIEEQQRIKKCRAKRSRQAKKAKQVKA